MHGENLKLPNFVLASCSLNSINEFFLSFQLRALLQSISSSYSN